MQLQFEIAGGMCQIKSYQRSDAMTGRGYRLHIECLACVVIYPAEEDERDLIAVALDRFDDVLSAERALAFSRREFQKVWISAEVRSSTFRWLVLNRVVSLRRGQAKA